MAKLLSECHACPADAYFDLPYFTRDTPLIFNWGVVGSAVFLAGSVLQCNLAHRQSVAVLCMLFKVMSNSMHHLSGALPLPYVPASVTRGALAAHMNSFAPPRCRTSQYRRTFVALSVSLWNDLGDPVLDGVGLVVLRAEPMLSFWPNLLFFFLFNCFLFFFLPWVRCEGLESSD